MIGVLALQGDVREHVAAVSSCGLRAVPVRRPAELDAVDALIIPSPFDPRVGPLVAEAVAAAARRDGVARR